VNTLVLGIDLFYRQGYYPFRFELFQNLAWFRRFWSQNW